MNTLSKLAALIKSGYTLQSNPDNNNEFSISGSETSGIEFYQESDDLRALIESVYNVEIANQDQSANINELKRLSGL